ncbi:MAG: hypothetical protein K2R98_23030 [Gemmataceae bacterium]|nr:hypothetical protein [Gemmataceae bacterium]
MLEPAALDREQGRLQTIFDELAALKAAPIGAKPGGGEPLWADLLDFGAGEGEATVDSVSNEAAIAAAEVVRPSQPFLDKAEHPARAAAVDFFAEFDSQAASEPLDLPAPEGAAPTSTIMAEFNWE